MSIYGHVVLIGTWYQLLSHIVAAGVDPDILKNNAFWYTETNLNYVSKWPNIDTIYKM